MKAIPVHEFFQYVSKFTLKSMLTAISYWGFHLIKYPSDDFNMFAAHKEYIVIHNGKKHKSCVSLYQTNLIDVFYEVINYGYYGEKEITLDEALYLIHLHVNLMSSRHTKKSSDTDFWLGLFGMLGEQKRFQLTSDFFDEFAREKYILEKISTKNHPKNNNGINFEAEFFGETNLSPDVYSALLFVLFTYFSEISPAINPLKLDSDLNHPDLSNNRITDMIKRYAIPVDEVRKSKLKRQIFYLKPIVQIDDVYISVNPFLILCTFVNSNFWVMRNKYLNSQKDKQKFTNAFGNYFEIYMEEVLERCLSPSQYQNIKEENDAKRADWHLTIGDYHFLIEQKSSISMLSIKQSTPDVEDMKNHICKHWGEAVNQLEETQKAYKLDKAIKIILVYEDYYNSMCLDKLFDLNRSLINDKSYWLVSIRDFERLMYTYKTDPNTFFKVISEKIEAEETSSQEGRDLSRFLSNHGIQHNTYLEQYGIIAEFDKIETYINCNEEIHD